MKFIFIIKMAKYKRRKYSRKRTFNRIAKNYFKVRLDCVQTIQHTTDATVFRENNGAQRTVSALLELCNDWDMYRRLFHSFKLTGIAMEVVPLTASPNQQGQPYTSLSTICLAFLTSRDNTDFNSCSEANFNIICTQAQRQRKYKGFNGGEFAWTSTDDLTQIDGKFYLGTNGNASTGAAVWSVRFTLYVTLKNTN